MQLVQIFKRCDFPVFFFTNDDKIAFELNFLKEISPTISFTCITDGSQSCYLVQSAALFILLFTFTRFVAISDIADRANLSTIARNLDRRP